jgi:hypothetical protein
MKDYSWFNVSESDIEIFANSFGKLIKNNILGRKNWNKDIIKLKLELRYFLIFNIEL